jgi:hypothetical protein
MSHLATIQTQVRDVTALTAACQEMGLEIQVAQEIGPPPTIRGWGWTREVDIAVKLHGRWDLGFERLADGSYKMVADDYLLKNYQDQAAEIGVNGGRLLQGYAFHAVAIQARRKGLSIFKTVNTDGSYRVVLSGGRL